MNSGQDSEHWKLVNEHGKNGGIAQLVERLLCKQDVSGSSPLTSTKRKKDVKVEIDEKNSALSLLQKESRMRMLEF